MQAILIGNYPADRQESMERFAQMLKRGFDEEGIATEIWKPIVFFGFRANSAYSSVGKWLGYIDKFILFPLIIHYKQYKLGVDKVSFFHICDHSNASYLSHLPANCSGITCHDVLAIRGALGYEDAYCTASRFGRILQKWILRSLSKAEILASVSNLTLQQLSELTKENNTKDWRVIHNGFNADFNRLEQPIAKQILTVNGIQTREPFILHVGSALPRKNRKLLLEMVHALGSRWTGKVCFAGQPIDDALLEHASQLGLKDRLISVVKPQHEILVALYSSCVAFIFPSYSEGFGWPVIEAQSCGAPVIASDTEPMPEVSGGAAIHIYPNDAERFANAFLSLQNERIRSELVRKGYENTKRFGLKTMIRGYLDLYGLNKQNLNVP